MPNSLSSSSISDQSVNCILLYTNCDGVMMAQWLNRSFGSIHLNNPFYGTRGQGYGSTVWQYTRYYTLAGQAAWAVGSNSYGLLALPRLQQVPRGGEVLLLLLLEGRDGVVWLHHPSWHHRAFEYWKDTFTYPGSQKWADMAMPAVWSVITLTVTIIW